MENAVQFQVQIVKTGSGAAEAVQEFKNLQTAAAAATSSATTMTGALHHQKEASKLAGEGLKVLNETALLVGMSGFPQLGMAVTAVRGELALARTAAQLTAVSLGAINVAVVGVVAVVGTGAAAWAAYNAELQETQSNIDAMGSQSKVADRIREQADELLKLSRISPEAYAKAIELAANPTWENIANAQKLLKTGKGTREEEDAINLLRELNQRLIGETLDGYEKEKFAAAEKFRLEMEQIQALAKKAGSQADVNTVSFVTQKAEMGFDSTLSDISNREFDAAETAFYREEEALRDNIDAMYAEAMRERAAETAVMLRAFEQGQTLDALQSTEDRITIAERQYTAQVTFYRQLLEEGRINSDELVNLDNRAVIARLQNTKKFEQQYTLHIMSMKEMNVQIAEQFAGGMARAFVAFASGTKSAGEAFKEFASSFLEMIAQMILQQIILNALKSSGLFGFADGGTATAAADGGVFPRYAATGLSGVSEVSAATYFPKFNVVAGEAGREMLTVLAKPRMMSIGGMDAVVGNAGNNRLAITDADALAQRSGSGGLVEIKVSMEAGLRADIIQTAVKGATVQVEQDLTRDTAIARNARSLTA